MGVRTDVLAEAPFPLRGPSRRGRQAGRGPCATCSTGAHPNGDREAAEALHPHRPRPGWLVAALLQSAKAIDEQIVEGIVAKLGPMEDSGRDRARTVYESRK
jgi:hypothetical protein